MSFMPDPLQDLWALTSEYIALAERPQASGEQLRAARQRLNDFATQHRLVPQAMTLFPRVIVDPTMPANEIWMLPGDGDVTKAQRFKLEEAP